MRVVTYLAAFVVLLSLSAFLIPGSSDFRVFFPSPQLGVVSLLLILALFLAIDFSYYAETYWPVGIKILGAILLAVVFIGVFSPSFFNIFYYEIGLGDMVTLVASGVMFLLAGVEAPQKSLIKKFAIGIGMPRIRPGHYLRLADARVRIWLITHRSPLHIPH